MEEFLAHANKLLPVVLLPRASTNLEINCDPGENVYINVSLTSVDVEGLDMEIYKGMCNVKVVDSYNVQSSRLEQQCNVLVSTEAPAPAPSALQQLMSPGVQARARQKTILYMGEDEHRGHTLQNIAEADPALQCTDLTEDDYIIEQNFNKKKYQCNNCKQIFYQLSTYKQHVSKHQAPARREPGTVKFSCGECGRCFQSPRKFHSHCLGHGDPDLECDKCHKVFASKFTLRAHMKLHSREYSCENCTRSYSSVEGLNRHVMKAHQTFMCDVCEYSTSDYSELEYHMEGHKTISSDTESAASVKEQTIEEQTLYLGVTDDEQILSEYATLKQSDDDIAKVISNEIFLLHAKKAKNARYNKKCNVCHKAFDRVGDLKRHLIEHVIKSTLAKTPVNKNGTLTIVCEVCERETFNKIDKYKAHLRQHAKLTIYECTFCDKSFSDSSNFSKHKKIHGVTFFQCDLCHRKFNSKKMIAQHMEYHRNNSPLPCLYCDKEFHFESMLNKHIRCAHTRNSSKFRCRFCSDYFRNLKGKWDHEWKIHNVRKSVIDCHICEAKFRKFSELKRHCMSEHAVGLPMAKKMIKYEYE